MCMVGFLFVLKPTSWSNVCLLLIRKYCFNCKTILITIVSFVKMIWAINLFNLTVISRWTMFSSGIAFIIVQYQFIQCKMCCPVLTVFCRGLCIRIEMHVNYVDKIDNSKCWKWWKNLIKKLLLSISKLKKSVTGLDNFCFPRVK